MRANRTSIDLCECICITWGCYLQQPFLVYARRVLVEIVVTTHAGACLRSCSFRVSHRGMYPQQGRPLVRTKVLASRLSEATGATTTGAEQRLGGWASKRPVAQTRAVVVMDKRMDVTASTNFKIRFVSYADRKRKRFDDLVVYCSLVDHYLAGHVFIKFRCQLISSHLYYKI